ncbi:Ribosome maturation factor rimP [Pseudomonas putida]|jgi:ribosome maturation factor RimP|uniref:Ribosome maturation factor RimP n=2 Tax=Pseudomonas TaxID=286 RepID=A0ABM7EL14_PSEPU|nr:ribosome maturation factor RimP [Pseudomonas putida NBRC 14164]GLO04992.1 ribosome maturation factor RimP [Pseudomonas putida]GLO09451.1 ribosome maturation factor RimP [Pseudomonas putida]GLO23363.1 ribosome maturation factor RimP [Pseudomonas putida]SUD74129.1 Ribosome maturation factor rimP [Pseudomonas putida]
MGASPIFHLHSMHEGVQVSSKLEQLQALLAPVVTGLGFECWGIEFVSQGKHSVLRVYIDKEGGILVDDCAEVSRQVSSVLDVEDPISSEYTLEVSSPGMERPLFTLEQFASHAGEQVKIKLRSPFEGRRNFQGLLRGVEEQDVVVQVDDQEFLLPIDSIDKANIIPSFD